MRTPLSILLVLALTSCGAESSLSDDSGYAWAGGDSDADADADTDTDTDADSDTDYDDGYDAEEELAYIKLEPVVVGGHVFVANPDRSSLTRISIADLAVVTEDIGPEPAIMVGAEAQGRVVILDTVEDAIQLITADSLEVQSVAVRPNLNQMTLSPDGRWAIGYHSSAVPEEQPDDGGSWSYSEVSVVDVSTGAHWPQSVGFEPASIQFADDSSGAVLVNDSWLTHLDLSGDAPVSTRIQFAETYDPPVAEEVIVTPAGRYALIRQFATSSLVLVDLAEATVSALDVGDNPTDLDVTADGARAVAVARGSGELWIYDLNDPTATPEVLSLPKGTVLGSISLSADGSVGLLYSTASGRSQFVSWAIDEDALGADTFQIHGSVKPIASVQVSPLGGTAILVHSAEDPKDLDPDSAYAGAPAITLVDMTDFFTNPIRLSSTPEGMSFSDNDRWAFFYQQDQPWLEVADLDRLLMDEQALLSNPAHVGVFPGTAVAYTSQAHVLGRVSFLDADSSTFQTITGFELNAEIEQD